MNKKFTFMVAALLATGTSAFATGIANQKTFATLESGKYYYIVGNAADDEEITDDDDYYLGVSGYMTAATTAASGATTPNAVKSDAYAWRVDITEKDDVKYVTFTNKSTKEKLAYSSVKGAFVTTKDGYSEPNLLTEFKIDGDNAVMLGKELTIATENSLTLGNGNTGGLLFGEISDISVNVEELQNFGNGLVFDFDGEIDGEELFNNVTVVNVKGGAGFLSDFETAKKQDAGTATVNFMLQVGASEYTEYDLSTADSDPVKAFKKAEFIILTPKAIKEGADNETDGTGYTYAKVKGEKLFYATGSVQDKALDIYPANNGVFTAYKNANKEGKYAFQNVGFWISEKQEDNKNDWTDKSTGAKPYIGYTDFGLAGGEDKLTSSTTPVYASVSGGTAVDVKTLVKGKLVVNILASENKESKVMNSVVYANPSDAATDDTDVIKFSAEPDETKAHKDAIYAQWLVSADEDANTITLYNRETALSIKNVTLFKTQEDGIYSVYLPTDGNQENVVTGLKDRYITLQKVENTTEWDGFLKLSANDVNSTEYYFSVDAGTAFEYKEGIVYADETAVKSSTKEDVKPMTFKLAQTTSLVDETNKLDTVVVNAITYNYYKDGKLTEANDTLKAISYTLAGLGNTGDNNGISAAFALGEDLEETGKFIFRQVDDQYQIAKVVDSEGVYSYKDENVKYVNDKDGNLTYDFTNGAIENAQAFYLNPVEVAPNYEVPESHIALQINGAYLGSKADGNAIMTNDTSMLKSTVADAAFSFYAFSADTVEAKTPSYYLSSNGKMMYNPANEIAALQKEYEALSPVFDAEEREELKAKIDAYKVNGENLVKFQQAKYEAADKVALADTTFTKADDLKPFKFNVLDVDGQAVLKNAANGYVKAVNDVVVFTEKIENAAKFDVVAAEAPTSNEGVSATEVKVVANEGSVVVKNAAGKNVVVSTILGQVVANEVLTSDNATINVPAGIVVVAVEGESFKVNVK